MTESKLRTLESEFSADPVPNLHVVLAELRETEPVSRVRFACSPLAHCVGALGE